MIAALSILRLLVFAASLASLASVREDRKMPERPHTLLLTALCVVLVVTLSLMVDGSITTGLLSMFVLAGIPFFARVFHPGGIDRQDIYISALVGFVLGTTSWTMAWTSALVAAGISAVLSIGSLLSERDADKRVPFGLILAAVAVVVPLAS